MSSYTCANFGGYRDKPHQPLDKQAKRSRIVLLVFGLLFSLLITRAFCMLFFNGSFMKNIIYEDKNIAITCDSTAILFLVKLY